MKLPAICLIRWVTSAFEYQSDMFNSCSRRGRFSRQRTIDKKVMNRKNKNILCVANLPSDVGYAWWLMESFWIEIAELGQRRAIRSYLCYPKINSVPELIRSSSIICDEFDLRSSTYAQLKEYIQSREIGLVYFSDIGSHSSLYVKLKLAGVGKIIYHQHTPGLRPRMEGWKRWVKLLINSSPLISADLNIAPTDFMKKRLLYANCVPEYKVALVQNGIPIKPLPHPGDLRQLLNLSQDSILAISLGRANRYKGIKELIDAVAAVEDRVGGCLHVIHIGDGPHLDEFKEHAVSRDIADKFHFLGRRTDILSLLQGADFAIHPSKGEVGYSLAILEYMYCGLAVIVPDNPSVCGATEHNFDGLIYQEEDIEDFAGRIEYACKNRKKIEKMGLRAHSKVVNKYSINDTHQALISIFSRMIE